MKRLRLILLMLAVGILIAAAEPVRAQCAMCSANADAGVSNGNTQAKGLNNGIIYLLAAPYLAAAAVGIIWYKKYRRKNVEINMRGEKLNLN